MRGLLNVGSRVRISVSSSPKRKLPYTWEQVCVVGNGMPQPIALIVLSEKGVSKELDKLNYSLENTLDIINPKLDSHEKIHNVIVVKEQWTVENKLLTPTMKIKRNLIEEKYKQYYDFWYEKQRIYFCD